LYQTAERKQVLILPCQRLLHRALVALVFHPGFRPLLQAGRMLKSYLFKNKKESPLV